MGRANKKDQVDQQAAAQPAGKGSNAEARQPFLLEAVLAVSRLLVILAGVSAGLAAWNAGCDPLTIAVRAGVALFTAGLLVWLANWFVAQRSLAVLKIQLEKVAAEPGAGSTIEREA
jgi:hypothetical protein